MKSDAVFLNGHSLTLPDASKIANGCHVKLSPEVKPRIEASRKLVEEVAHQAKPVYGVNTGFGFLAHKKISFKELAQLQLNLVKSHAAGYGDPLSLSETRLAMALRLNVLAKGFTGVRYELCLTLLNLINAGIYPHIPEYGSVGASGDLAPLSHLALSLIGEGDVFYQGKMMPARKALNKAGLKPIKLVEKEGLGLINGTQIMLSVGILALVEALLLVEKSDLIAAFSFEAFSGNVEALDPLIHKARGQQGQIDSAQAIRRYLKGSFLFDPAIPRRKIQDPYSLRCAPQIHGATRDALSYVQQIAENELNAATDNPLVFTEENKILSGGNFHGQPLALSFDFAAMAIAELANVSDRRLELLMNPHLSGLPAFLAPDEGLNSGYMAAQYLTASLVNENKILSHPACTDSIPGNVGIEDHVSMGMTSARKLKKIVQNVKIVLAVEMLAAAQAIDLRHADPLGKITSKVHKTLRDYVTPLKKDRIIAKDIEQAVQVFDLLSLN